MQSRLIRSSSLSFICGLTVLLRSAQIGIADDYSIKLDRPTKVGMVFRSTITGYEEITRVDKKNGIRVDGLAQKKVVSMVSDQKVLEVTDHGFTVKLECTIVKCERTADGRTTELVPPGKKVLVQRKGKATSFMIDNAEVPKETTVALELVLRVYDPAHPTEDEAFGTAERKKVGDSWKGNAEAVFASMRESGVPIQKGSVEVNMKLADVQMAGDQKLMTIQGRVNAVMEKGFRYPSFPEWLSVADGKMDVSLSNTLPVDPPAPSLGGKRDVTISMTTTGKAPDGSVLTTDVTMRTGGEWKAEFR
jgi:hypothetical protein